MQLVIKQVCCGFLHFPENSSLSALYAANIKLTYRPFWRVEKLEICDCRSAIINIQLPEFGIPNKLVTWNSKILFYSNIVSVAVQIEIETRWQRWELFERLPEFYIFHPTGLHSSYLRLLHFSTAFSPRPLFFIVLQSNWITFFWSSILRHSLYVSIPCAALCFDGFYNIYINSHSRLYLLVCPTALATYRYHAASRTMIHFGRSYLRFIRFVYLPRFRFVCIPLLSVAALCADTCSYFWLLWDSTLLWVWKWNHLEWVW